jgi:uncharacterized protein (DUF983 family)
VTATGPGALRQLGRGLARRCPRCGSGGLFPGWFRMSDRCPGCGLYFEREEGYWLGAMAVNLGMVSGLFLAVLAVGLALTIPDVAVGPLLAATLPVVILGPLLLFGVSRTLWVAIDRVLRRALD